MHPFDLAEQKLEQALREAAESGKDITLALNDGRFFNFAVSSSKLDYEVIKDFYPLSRGLWDGYTQQLLIQAKAAESAMERLTSGDESADITNFDFNDEYADVISKLFYQFFTERVDHLTAIYLQVMKEQHGKSLNFETCKQSIAFNYIHEFGLSLPIPLEGRFRSNDDNSISDSMGLFLHKAITDLSKKITKKVLSLREKIQEQLPILASQSPMIRNFYLAVLTTYCRTHSLTDGLPDEQISSLTEKIKNAEQTLLKFLHQVSTKAQNVDLDLEDLQGDLSTIILNTSQANSDQDDLPDSFSFIDPKDLHEDLSSIDLDTSHEIDLARAGSPEVSPIPEPDHTPDNLKANFKRAYQAYADRSGDDDVPLEALTENLRAAFNALKNPIGGTLFNIEDACILYMEIFLKDYLDFLADTNPNKNLKLPALQKAYKYLAKEGEQSEEIDISKLDLRSILDAETVKTIYPAFYEATGATLTTDLLGDLPVNDTRVGLFTRKLVMQRVNNPSLYIQQEIISVENERKELAETLQHMLDYAGLRLRCDVRDTYYIEQLDESECETSTEKVVVIKAIAASFLNTVLNHDYYKKPNITKIESINKAKLLKDFSLDLAKIEDRKILNNFKWDVIGKFFATVKAIILGEKSSSTLENTSQIKTQSATRFDALMHKATQTLAAPTPATRATPIAAAA